jgi:protein-S-isoprenylcysteine O-methyltransferase Ste14
MDRMEGFSSAERAAYNLFALFAASWLLAAVWSRRTSRRPVFGSQLLYNMLLLMGMGMLMGRVTGSPQLWRPWAPVQWLFVGIEAAGFAFCWWARIHLGALWSGSVTRKEDHRIIDTGPYGLVRHPIYTGLIVAGFAIAAISGSAVSVAGSFVLLASWWVKARLEEQFLRAELGAEAYDAYARRVPMLVPFAPK